MKPGSWINSADRIPRNPYCFRAWDSGGTTLTDATPVQINLATEDYDYNNNFATSAYTAPMAGVYHFAGAFNINGAVASGVISYAMVYVDGAVAILGASSVPASNTGASVSGDLLLAAGAVVTFRGAQDSGGNEATTATSIRTWFSGHLVHAT